MIILLTPNQTSSLPKWMFCQKFKSSLLLIGQCSIQVHPSNSSDDLCLLFCLFLLLCSLPSPLHPLLLLDLNMKEDNDPASNSGRISGLNHVNHRYPLHSNHLLRPFTFSSRSRAGHWRFLSRYWA